jgi:hypothetical protein
MRYRLVASFAPSSSSWSRSCSNPGPSSSTAASLVVRLALHCCFCNHWSSVKPKPTAVAVPVVVYSTAAAAASSALRGGRCGSLTPVLSYMRPVLGERSSLGRAAALLASCPPSYHPKSTWACLWCRPSPEFPCPSVWVPGWSTRHLCANNPQSNFLCL